MPKSRANVETALGRCSQHGQVQAVRDKPRPNFPFIVYLVRRVLAKRAAFTCPECGKEVATG